jgi:hypothetical protein
VKRTISEIKDQSPNSPPGFDQDPSDRSSTSSETFTVNVHFAQNNLDLPTLLPDGSPHRYMIPLKDVECLQTEQGDQMVNGHVLQEVARVSYETAFNRGFDLGGQGGYDLGKECGIEQRKNEVYEEMIEAVEAAAFCRAQTISSTSFIDLTQDSDEEMPTRPHPPPNSDVEKLPDQNNTIIQHPIFGRDAQNSLTHYNPYVLGQHHHQG